MNKLVDVYKYTYHSSVNILRELFLEDNIYYLAKTITIMPEVYNHFHFHFTLKVRYSVIDEQNIFFLGWKWTRELHKKFERD
jgi:hypothetical protein